MRKAVSAKFLLAAPPPAVTVVPEGFKITKCPERRATNGHFAKNRGGAMGGSLTSAAMGATYHGAKQHLRNAS